MLLFYWSSLLLLVYEPVPGFANLDGIPLIHLLAFADVPDLSISEVLKELKQYILIVITELIESQLCVGHVDMLRKVLFDIKLVAIAITVFFFNEFV
jgi:hypothetical protein